jgi:predicted HTH domain antitoxin
VDKEKSNLEGRERLKLVKLFLLEISEYFLVLVVYKMVSSDKNKLISLKEAAKITGYSSDYIGQLIRSGKIPGKQVYANIQWMTSADAIKDYRKKSDNKKNDNTLDKINIKRRKLAMEIAILRLFFTSFRYALPLLVVIVVSLVSLFTYMGYLVVAPESSFDNVKKVEEGLSF